MQAKLRALWRTEPVRACGLAAAIIVFVAAKAGIILDTQSIASALLIVVPILLGTETARSKVTPHHPAAARKIIATSSRAA